MIPTLKHIVNKRSDTLDIILPGGSYGIETPFMQKIISTCIKNGHSVAAFNFLYYQRGEDQSSGPELKEEVSTLKKVMSECNAGSYKHIRFIAKSLGALVASFYLKSLSPEEQEKLSIVILGLLTDCVDLTRFRGNITIIQGEKDKHGNISQVRNILKNSLSKNIKYFEIKNADHSYCDPTTKEPLYQDEVLKVLSTL